MSNSRTQHPFGTMMYALLAAGLLTGCVGYIKLGRNAELPVPPANTAGNKTCAPFTIPALIDPGDLPPIHEEMSDDQLVEMLSMEVVRLRDLNRRNGDRIQSAYDEYQKRCGTSVFLHPAR